MSDCTQLTMTEAVAPFRNESQESLLAMRIWTLMQTATSLGVEPLTVEELVRASGLHAKLNRREREALDIVLDVQRANTSGTFLPVHPNPLRANARQFYDIKDKSAVILYLQCLVSNYLGRTIYGDNGVDPILGAPHPPINYQLFIDETARYPEPRLTWTVPDVNLIIEVEQSQPQPGDYLTKLTLVNYQRPLWTIGGEYIENSAVRWADVPYRSLQDANTGHQPDTSPEWWVEDTTVFSLHRMLPLRNEDAFTEMVRSDNSPQFSGLAQYSFVEDGDFIRFESTLDYENLLDSERVYYVSASFNGTTLSPVVVALGEPRE